MRKIINCHFGVIVKGVSIHLFPLSWRFYFNDLGWSIGPLATLNYNKINQKIHE